MSGKIYKAILVDDETDAIDLLAELLKEYPEIEVVDTVNDTRKAYRAILENEPDLVFLDIRMPRETGLELSEKLKNLPFPPAVIFITAYDQFAISAIKQAALDYVLKPVDRKKLREAVARFKQTKRQAETDDRLEQLFSRFLHSPKIKFNTRTGFTMLNPAEIIYFQAEGNYSEIHTAKGEKEVVTTNLGNIEKALPGEIFYRISRTHIVNTNLILRVDRKNRSCELGVNGDIINLNIPKNKIRELEKRLSGNF